MAQLYGEGDDVLQKALPLDAFRHGSGSGSGIELTANASHVTVSNCVALADASWDGTPLQPIPLTVAAGVSYLAVVGNDFSGAGAAGDPSANWVINSTSRTNVFRDNITNKGVGDAVNVWRTTNQSVPTATATDIIFNSNPSDPNNMHDESGTAPMVAWSPGDYTVNFTVQFASHASGDRQVNVVGSDGVIVGAAKLPAVSGAVTIVPGSATTCLAEGQWLKLQAVQNSGGALNVESGSQYSPTATMRLK